MKRRKTTKTWQRTRLRNLLRHKSGSYYARAFAGGKEVWKSLKTSHFSVAEAKLTEFLKDHRQRRSNGNGEVSAKMTFGEAATVHLQDLDDNLRIKPRTRDYWRECLTALTRNWPNLRCARDITTGTKNWEVRRVPLIPDARALFRRMRSEWSDEPLTQKSCA